MSSGVGMFNWTERGPHQAPRKRSGNTTGRHIFTCRAGCGRTVSARHFADAWCTTCKPAPPPLPVVPLRRDDDVDMSTCPF